MPKSINEINNIYGKLKVISKNGIDRQRNTLWDCLCECGKIITVPGSHLRSGNTRSCGCTRTKHGMHNSKEYLSWIRMHQRCKENAKCFRNYKAKGISVCDEWNSFEKFYSDMGSIPNGRYTLDRIDNNRGYSKENCRWATYKEQARNMSSNVVIKMFDETLCLAAWCELLNRNYSIVKSRLYQSKWSNERALLTPTKKGFSGT